MVSILCFILLTNRAPSLLFFFTALAIIVSVPLAYALPAMLLNLKRSSAFIICSKIRVSFILHAKFHSSIDSSLAPSKPLQKLILLFEILASFAHEAVISMAHLLARGQNDWFP